MDYNETLQQAVNLAAQHPDKNQTELAELAGCKRSTFGERLRNARAAGYEPAGMMREPEIEHPILPEKKRRTGQIIDHLCDAYTRLATREKAKHWMQYKVKVDGPVGICFVGDIHAEAPGCDWPTLKRHLEELANTEYCYGVFLGDVLDNWVGRLQRLCADHGITKAEGKQLTEWIAKRCGVNWLLWVIGNHDEWNEFDDTIREHVKNICHAEYWRARFELKFPCGRIAKIDAAHDHKGHSQWNPLHGQQKAALMEEMAHIVISGHKHTYAMAKMQHPANGFGYWLCRAKGYKNIDSHAKRLQYDSQTTGESIFAVFDPSLPEANWIVCFEDVAQGVAYLKHRREIWEKK